MKTRSQLFHELLASFTPEERAAFDAALNDPNRQPVEWLNRPDPHGMNWEWLKLSDHEVVELTEEEADFTETEVAGLSLDSTFRDDSRPLGYKRLMAYAGLAACLTGFGVILGLIMQSRGPAGTELIVASATPSTVAPRGPNDPPPSITITSNVKGFATTILLGPGRPQRPEITPDHTADDLPVAPNQPVNSGPLPQVAKNATVALVIITPTPSTADIHKALQEKKYSADEVDELQAFIKNFLLSKNFAQIGIVKVDLPPLKAP